LQKSCGVPAACGLQELIAGRSGRTSPTNLNLGAEYEQHRIMSDKFGGSEILDIETKEVFPTVLHRVTWLSRRFGLACQPAAILPGPSF